MTFSRLVQRYLSSDMDSITFVLAADALSYDEQAAETPGVELLSVPGGVVVAVNGDEFGRVS